MEKYYWNVRSLCIFNNQMLVKMTTSAYHQLYTHTHIIIYSIHKCKIKIKTVIKRYFYRPYCCVYCPEHSELILLLISVNIHCNLQVATTSLRINYSISHNCVFFIKMFLRQFNLFFVIFSICLWTLI